MKYPGNCATPREMARWMAWTAETQYGLPGILPVMCSCVELTDAWVSEGCLEDVPGYLNNVDYDSYGLFQQRPSMGWGTWEQVTNAEHALRAFCREAASIEYYMHNWRSFPSPSPGWLGTWCQKVQGSGYPEAYRDKGYPLALKLLEDEVPTHNVGFDKDGWMLDLHTGAYLQSTRKEATLYTNAQGWLWGRPGKPVEPVKWEWPWANEPVRNGDYLARHPTRYTWRADIEEWARYLVDNYDVWCNTYYDHPEGYWRTETSLDVWGPAGRGDPVDPTLGNQIFDLLFYDQNKPDIEWIIYNRTIYGAWNSWYGEPFGDGSVFMNHEDHIHCTWE